MSALSIQPTYPIFTDIDGQPLEAGYVWIGTASLDPQTNPINVYWDAALTIPAPQPIRTFAGYPAFNGTPARLYVNSDYSIRVMNKNGSTVYSALAATERYNGGVISNINASQVIYDPPFTGAVTTNVEDKLAQNVSVFDFMTSSQVADVRAGTATIDVTTAIQAAFDSIGAITAGDFQNITPSGVTLYFPPGRYLVTSTLFMPSNVRMQGTGMGTQFKFNPTAPGTNFLQRKNNNVGGSALNRSNFSMHFENFYVFAAQNGGSTIGRNGSSIPTINTNTADCFNLLDCAISSFTNVSVTDFWYGTAFNLRLASLFAYYNYMVGCYVRDCQLGVQTTSASHLTDCYFGHGVAFPPPTIQANVQYAVSFDGFRGCAMHGGSIESSCSVALIKQNNAGHTFTGVYMEAFGVTPIMMDASSLVDDSGSLLIGGNSYGFNSIVRYNENITRGGSAQMTHGAAFNFGDCSEIEIEQVSTRQSPSFREGLPGNAHFPAGGTLTISTDSFIDNTSMALTRGAGTAATQNQMSYAFVIKTSEKVLTNIWLTCLVKVEGGEDNFDMRVFDTTNGNAIFKKQMDFTNGWSLYATYLRRVDNSNSTFFARQFVGSTDPSQVVKVTALRAYTNGYFPIPAPYKWQEFRTAAPTTGTWKRGDIVWNSQPSALGTPGWMCTTAGTPGTWSAMANLV